MTQNLETIQLIKDLELSAYGATTTCSHPLVEAYGGTIHLPVVGGGERHR